MIINKTCPNIFFYITIFLSFILNHGPVSAQLTNSIPLDAKSFVLIDAYTNQVIAEKNANDPVHPASLTKLMTAYIAFDSIKNSRLQLTQRLPVSKRAWDERLGNGTLMFLAVGMTPTVDETLKGLIVQSGNDAAVVLAEAIAGSVDGFVYMMNSKAQEWNLQNTNFNNATGLTDDSHKMSALDAAKIMSRILRDHPVLFHTYFSLKEYTFNGIRQFNRNDLLDVDHGIDGGKTGFTEAAGYCLAASLYRQDAKGDEHRLIGVVMGSPSKESRRTETLKLLNWGFNAFRWESFFQKNSVVGTMSVWQGESSNVELTVDHDVSVAVKNEIDRKKLVVDFDVQEPLIAPLEKGQRVGWIRIMTRDGVFISRHPLLVYRAVIQGSYPKRLFHSLVLYSKNKINQMMSYFENL